MCRLSHLSWTISVLLAAVAGFAGGRWREHLATNSALSAEPVPEVRCTAAVGEGEAIGPLSSGAGTSSWACEHVLADIDAASATGVVVRDRAWWDATRALTSEDCAVVLQRVDGLPMRFLREDLRVELLELWSRMDCSAALGWLHCAAEADRRPAWIGAITRGWASVDPRAAAVWVAELTEMEERDAALGAVFRPLAAIDPAAAFALMRRFSGGPLLDEEWLGIVFVSWGAQDPSGAFGAVAELEKDLWSGDEFTAAMTALAERDPAAVCAWIQQNASSHYHDEACAGLVAGLMKGGSRQAVEFARGLAPGTLRAAIHEEALDQLEDLDAAAAFAMVASAPPDLVGGDMALSVAARYASEDPVAVARWMNGLPVGTVRTEAITCVAAELANHDGPLATVLALELPAGKARDLVLGRVFGRRASVDPEATLREIDELSGDVDRDRLVGALIDDLSHRDDDLAAAFVFALPSGALQQSAISTVARTFRHSDQAEEGLAWLAQLPESPARQNGILQLCERISYADPVRALTVLEAMGATGGRDHTLAGIVFRFANTDLTAASAWTQNLPEGGMRRAAVAGLVHSQFRHDPAAALRAIESLATGDDRSRLAVDVARQWATQDRAAAAEWVNRLAFGPVRDGFLAGIAGAIADESPRQGAEFVAQLPAGSGRDEAARQLALTWGHRDPAAAAAWAEQSPSAGLPGDVTPMIAAGWARNDPIGAAEWLSRLPADVRRDDVVDAFVAHASDVVPDVAAVWATRIGDLERRAIAIERVGGAWLEADRSAAMKWLASTDLAWARQQRLLVGK